MALPYPGWAAVYGEIKAASNWSQLGTNLDALAAGTGLNDRAVTGLKVALATVKSENMDWATATTFRDMKTLNSDVSISAVSDTAIPGLGTVSVTADGVRRIRITFKAVEAWRGSGGLFSVKIWENGVGGTLRAYHQSNAVVGFVTVPVHLQYISLTVPPAGTYTFTVSIQAASGSPANISGSTSPMVLLAELF